MGLKLAVYYFHNVMIKHQELNDRITTVLADTLTYLRYIWKACLIKIIL